MRVTSKEIARLVKESVQKILKESEGGHTPSVYVGTYRKYNNGSLFGEWVDLDKFKNSVPLQKILQTPRIISSK